MPIVSEKLWPFALFAPHFLAAPSCTELYIFVALVPRCCEFSLCWASTTNLLVPCVACREATHPTWPFKHQDISRIPLVGRGRGAQQPAGGSREGYIIYKEGYNIYTYYS